VLLQWQTVAAARGCFFFLLLPLPLSRVYTILRRLFSGGGGSVRGGGATVALLLPLLFLLSFSSFLLFHSPVSLFRFFFSADLPPSLSLFLLLLPFLTVQVLLSTTGRIVAAGGGSGGCGRRPRWREKQREEQLLGTRTKDDFFLTLDPPSSFLRGTLCFFWYKLSALGSTRKHPNHRLKVAKMNCQFCAGN